MSSDYRRLVMVYAALQLLLATTIGSSLIDLGMFNPVINIGVAVAKSCLIFWFFMELRNATGLVRLFAVTGFCWLLILFVLGGADWMTRPGRAGLTVPSERGLSFAQAEKEPSRDNVRKNPYPTSR